MRTISNSEFLAHPELYFDLARKQDVRIQKGGDVFQLTREIAEPDDDPTDEEVWRYFATVFPNGLPAMLSDEEEIANAITGEELLERIHEDIDKKWAERNR